MYRLKKWYPSLPKDWKVGMEVGQGDRLNGMYYSPCSSTFKDTVVSFKEVEENEEFWEKVVPKEPIIKTTDGLELIAGDRYFVPQVEGKLKRLSGSEIMFYVEPDMPENETKRFAKRENAQAYIENNIEVFSASDIEKLFKTHSRNIVDSSLFMEVRKMVKERLKNG